MLARCSRRDFIMGLVGLVLGRKVMAALAPAKAAAPAVLSSPFVGDAANPFAFPIVSRVYPQLLLSRGHSFSASSLMYSPYTFEIMPRSCGKTLAQTEYLRACLPQSFSKVEVVNAPFQEKVHSGKCTRRSLGLFVRRPKKAVKVLW